MKKHFHVYFNEDELELAEGFSEYLKRLGKNLSWNQRLKLLAREVTGMPKKPPSIQKETPTPSYTQTVEIKKCLKGKTNPTKADCILCKTIDWNQWRACQEINIEQGRQTNV